MQFNSKQFHVIQEIFLNYCHFDKEDEDIHN